MHYEVANPNDCRESTGNPYELISNSNESIGNLADHLVISCLILCICVFMLHVEEHVILLLCNDVTI